MTSATLNKVMLIGICGKDTELLYVKPSGQAVCNFRIATHKHFKTNDGHSREETTWHNLTAWQGVAEYVAANVKKGTKIYVEGELTMGTYTDANNVRKNHLAITVLEIKVLNP